MTSNFSQDTLEVPKLVRDEMRKAMAFSRLREAAQALLDENTETARASYTVGGKFVDADWRSEDPDHFKICREVRNALREAARCFPDASSSAKACEAK
jgi:hypothetical protein